MNRLLRVNTLGCRWDLDLSALKPEFAARVEVLWARAAAPDADVSEPDGFPQVVRVGPPLAKSEVEVLADEDVFLGDGDRAIADETSRRRRSRSVGAGDLGGEVIRVDQAWGTARTPTSRSTVTGTALPTPVR